MKVFMTTVFVFGMTACGIEATGPGDEPMEEQAPVQELAMAELKDPAAVQAKIQEKLAANPEAAAAPRHAACGRVGPRLDGSRTNDASSPNTALQRSGSSTSCDRPGQLNPTDDAIYFCFTSGNDGFTWTYLERVGGNRGWVRDDLLRDFGSFVFCGF